MTPVQAAAEHLRAGRVKQAVQALRAHLRRHGDDDRAWFVLGQALSQDGQHEAGLHALGRALAADRGDARRWLALGVATLRAKGGAGVVELLKDSPPAIAGDADVLALLADGYAAVGEAGSAVPVLERVLAARPGHVPAMRTLARVFAVAGRTDEAVGLLRRCAEAGGWRDFRDAAAYCFHTNYSGLMTPDEVAAEHRRLHELLQRVVPPGPPVRVDVSAGRALRVGLLSADFQQHSVAYFAEPLIEHLDRARWRVVCVSASSAADEVTSRLRAKADEWVDASAQDPAAMLNAVRSARLDVLIELGGLTGPGRVAALAQRVAPVQATYLGYPNTTGVPNIDYRIVDAHTDPQGAERLATERLVRVEGCFVCYRPPEGSPAVCVRDAGAPLALGSFNTSLKMSPQSVALWARVMRRLPGSVLVLKRKEFADPWVAGQFVERFGREGIAPERLRLVGKTPSVAEHLAAYGGVDIALDTYPYHGTTTTCEALWMGVPVVSLAGPSHASRVGKSLLHAAGMGEWAVDTPEAFEEAVVGLAADRAALAALRAGLRDRVGASALCDGAGFARRFERVLEEMWASVSGTSRSA